MDDLLPRARKVLPQDWPFGCVRAPMHEHGSYPQHARRADGAWFEAADGRRYIDWFVGGGVSTLGHRHPAVQQAMLEQLELGVHLSLPCALEVEVAERLCALFPGTEQVAFGKNGSDVTTAAARLARAVTGREHLLVCGYHGWHDWAKAVSPEVTGIPASARALTHEFAFNDLAGAERLLAAHAGEVAAVFLEPVRYTTPTPEFLDGLRRLCDRHGCWLVFDEIVTGLRVARGGAQQLYGVRPDLTCLAKSLANGLPLAALLGRRQHLKHLPPAFFALTYSREALSLAAAKAALDVHGTVDVAGHLACIGGAVRDAFAAAAARHGLPFALYGHPAMLHLHVADVGRLRARGALALLIECCQRQGVYLQPYRVLPSLAHGEAEVAATAKALDAAMATVRTAADRGLHGLLDSPIWGDFEHAGDAAVATSATGAPTSRSQPLGTAGWLALPKGVQDLGASATTTTGRSDCRAGGATGGPILTIERTGRGGAGMAAIDLHTLQRVDARLTASFRLLAFPTGNATVTIGLSLSGTQRPSWHEVQYVVSYGQTPQAAVSFAGSYRACPAALGTVGRLELSLRAGVVRGAHCEGHGKGDGGDRTELAEAVIAEEPRRVRFQVAVQGELRAPLQVELVALEWLHG